MREQLTEHFYRDEFACPCGCGFDTVDFGLVTFLQANRYHFDRPVIITERGGACRCPAYNAEVGGAANSQHLFARAADYVVEGVPAEIVQEFADQYGINGLGRYTDFTHADTRVGFARW